MLYLTLRKERERKKGGKCKMHDLTKTMHPIINMARKTKARFALIVWKLYLKMLIDFREDGRFSHKRKERD